MSNSEHSLTGAQKGALGEIVRQVNDARKVIKYTSISKTLKTFLNENPYQLIHILFFVLYKPFGFIS